MNDTMQKTLEVEVLNIQKGEYLSEALKRQGYPMLPSNAIINKVMTGTGATYMELDTKLSPRNSIVIEPFKSSVENKVLIFNEAQGVFKEITVKQLTTSLKNSNIQYKKIITTPEGFLNKVLKVARCLKINVYKEFFCLFDEAEQRKRIRRENPIAARLDDFAVQRRMKLQHGGVKFHAVLHLRHLLFESAEEHGRQTANR